MKRALALMSVIGLVLVPSAAAKGPHAVLSFGSEPAEAGRPWDVTLQLMETRGTARPVLMARQGERLVAARGRVIGSDDFMTRYRIRTELPAEGPWTIAVVDRKRRFEFPAVRVGSGEVPQDYVAFPEGSMADRQGGGGPYDAPGPVPAGGEPLPPETVDIAADEPAASEDGGGSAIWILPVAGLVLAGAGAGVWRLRR